MNEEDYTSDSDQSDEDFCPDKVKQCEDSVSEEEEEEEDVDSEALSDAEVKTIAKSKQPKRKNKRIEKSKKSKHLNNNSDNEDEKNDIENGKSTSAPKRSTRVQTRNGPNVSQTSCPEKDKIDSDDEEKERTDSLWSSFLSDVKPTNSVKSNKTASTTNTSKIEKIEKDMETEVSVKKPIFETNVKAEATSTASLEAENPSVQQMVDNPLTKKIQSTSPFEKACKTPIGVKRPVSMGGLGSILGSIEKKKKVSVLEKSKLDWNSYKQDEGLDEELQTHNKGKDGYLERMDFLQRTDLRQFEIEKKLRVSRRAK